MPVEATTVEYVYTGDGVTAVFDFPSKFTSNADIAVGLDRVEQSSGFTVTGAGAAGGGTVTFTTAPAAGSRVALLRRPPVSQLIDFVNGQTILEGTLDTALDKLTMVSQYLLREIQKCVRVSEFDPSVIDVLPFAETRANRLLGFSSDGKAVSVVDVTDAVAVTEAVNAAAGSASAAGTSAAAAAGSATDAAGSATDAAGSATAAAGALDMAATQAGIATAAAGTASIARDAALLSRGLFASTAAGIGNGVSGTTGLVGGSGGTDGWFALAFSGGTPVVPPVGRFLVSGHAVVSIVIDYPGYYSSGSPTLSFAASSGLTGASATAVMSANTPVGGYFSVPVIGSTDAAILYRVDAGPVATEITRAPSSVVAKLLALFATATSDNLYHPDTTLALPAGALAPANYNNGGSWGTVLSSYGTTGIITGLTPGNWYSVNITTAPSDVTLSYAQGGFFWTGSNVFSSQVASNSTTMVFSADRRSVVFQAVTSRVSFNLLRAGDAAMAPVFAATLAALMVSAGTTLLPYVAPVDPAAPYAPGPAFAAPVSITDDVLVQSDGAGWWYVRTKWDATTHLVQKLRFGAGESTSGNDVWDHYGARRIPAATRADLTIAAHALSVLIPKTGGDESSPINFNGMWLGGNHGPLCRKTTITAHGLVQGDIGSVWSDGSVQWTLAQIVDANTVRWLPASYGGTVTSWTLSIPAITGSTLTHVSGGVATAGLTVAADASDQVWPYNRGRTGTVTLDGAALSDAGVWAGKVIRFTEQYEIPNLARAIDYIKAHAGASDNSVRHTAIATQIAVSQSISVDWTGAVRYVWSPVDGEGYAPGQYGGAQMVAPPRPAVSGSLTYWVPGAKTGGGYSFQSGQSITTWSTSVTLDKTTYWADPADPPRSVAYVAASAGAPTWGLYYAIDDACGQGKAASRAALTNALLLSSFKKSYLISGGPGSTAAAGTLHEMVNVTAVFDPTADTALTWVVTYPHGAGYAVAAHATGTLANHWVPVAPRLIGRPVTLLRGGAIATLKSEVVDARGVLVSWAAAGEIVVTIG